ncbi:MAG TPA: hypothetical protein VGY98_06905, partial [Verrucomicrobiae bacterium]|nr:hypothetical protein [Verrucomicrobiae bacterium]
MAAKLNSYSRGKRRRFNSANWVMRNKFLTVCFLVLTIKSIQAQSVVINGDFSGGLTNWTVVQPPDDEILAGSLGQIQFVGETRLSEAFEAQVGYNSQQNLEQTVSLSAGVQYDFYADVAAIYPIYNLDGGTITISIEGNDVASISFGAGITQYGTLEGTYNPTESGNELMAINFDRSYEAS